MSTTPETSTPETDALEASIKEKKQADFIAAIRFEGKCRRLERERDTARQALAEASNHLSAFLGFHADALSLDQVRALSETLQKIQPLIKQ